MTSEHLLPANATPLEQALSLANDSLSRLALPTDAIRQFKTDPSDPLLPWLIWEYGLGELLPYLPEPRQAIAEGILWQRLRGTPAALTTALAWIGATATIEQEPPGVHFAEFQLDPGQVLDSDSAIAHLIAIARLSAPARSRLSRIYHGYDLRRLVLDESRLGEALLSDHSGVFWTDGKTKLSFGRVAALTALASSQAVAPNREAVRFAVARLIDRTLLDFSSLGDPGHTPNEEILHSHLFTLANVLGVADPVGLRPERRFCRAMVVLSDSTPLGDINANLPHFVWLETGAPIALGSGDRLSATPHRLTRVEVLVRFYANHPAALAVPVAAVTTGRAPTTTAPVMARADALLGVLRLGEQRSAWDVLALTRTYGLIQDPLPNPGRFHPRLYQRAQVVLSETVLGEVNSRTPRRAIYRIRPIARLGDLTLGERAEFEWRLLTEMRIDVSGLTETAPYVFEDAHPSLSRLLTQAVASGPKTAATPARTSLSSMRAAWQGQTWTGVRWPSSSWQDTRELIGTANQTLS